jgi:hypothetical protein
VGGGPGFQNSTFTGGRANSDFAVQAVAGLHVFLAERLSLFGEYKYTHVSQTFGLGNQDAILTLNVSHLVGGLAFHFGRQNLTGRSSLPFPPTPAEVLHSAVYPCIEVSRQHRMDN